MDSISGSNVGVCFMAKNDVAGSLLIAGGIIALGTLLLSDPHCTRGCRTVAEHLISHGIEDLLAGLLG